MPRPRNLPARVVELGQPAVSGADLLVCLLLSLRLFGLQQAFEFGQCRDVPLPAGSTLGLDQTGEVKRGEPPVEGIDQDGMRLHLFVSTQARDFGQKVDWADRE